jgi:hypothetical protein
MPQTQLKSELYETTTRYPEQRTPVVRPFDDASGDNETVQRYRRFFATHDLNGLPRGEATRSM